MSDSVSLSPRNCPMCGGNLLCIENNPESFEEVCVNDACSFFHLVMPNPQKNEDRKESKNASIL